MSNIKDPEAAESLLAQGAVDFVGVGRGHLADPDWCRKAFSGRQSEIRKCIGCLACFGELAKLNRVKCSVNPEAGREREYARPEMTGNGRTIAVIGGGPAGIEAALTLKRRGFKPVIFDGADRLGGTLNTADKGYGKDKITSYVDSLITQVEKAGIEIRLGKPATVEDVKAISPAGVILAIGAEPIIPPVDGVKGERVVTAESVLLEQTKPTGNVAVIGAGMTGLETAEYLALKGCRVTMADMLPNIGSGIYPTVVADVMGRLAEHAVTILTSHKLVKILEGGLELQRLSDKQTVRLEAEWVVLAIGVRQRRAILDEFRAAFDRVLTVGDARVGARILEATQDAHGKAFVFD